MKLCPKCSNTKPLSEFYVVKDVPTCYCIPCKLAVDKDVYHNKGGKERQRANRVKNNEAYKKREKQWRDANKDRSKGKLLQKYWPELTWQEALKEFNVLLLKQNFVCKICGNPEYRPSKKGSAKVTRDLSVDHCHRSNKVRGLLCDDCNVLLGRAKDSPLRCDAAASYLRSNSDDAA